MINGVKDSTVCVCANKEKSYITPSFNRSQSHPSADLAVAKQTESFDLSLFS